MWIMILEEQGPDNRTHAQSGQPSGGPDQFRLISFSVWDGCSPKVFA
jgi:hypothetical protein